ncbi:AIRE regulator, partial [Cepphus grylle]|nr:AIRE regulator [Cepphus grylle]
MAGLGGEGDLRHLLKLHRTEIAMAVDDIFPLLHGLADHDIVPEHVFKETLSRTEREGSHRAFYALLTWLLGCEAATLRNFWHVLFKDYNLERYSRLRPLRSTFPREVELGRQRRSRCLSPSPTALAPHRSQGKRKAPEEQEGAQVMQPSLRHAASPGNGDMDRSLKPPARPKASQSVRTPPPPAFTPAICSRGCPCLAAWPWLAGVSLHRTVPAAPHKPLSCPQSGEPRVHPQDQLPAPATHSQDPAPHQENEDECAACGDGGELICCDGCPRAFHLACLVPPLPRVPSGMWQCSSCVASAPEPGQPLEVNAAVERPPEVLGEEACGTQRSGGDGSVCGCCFTQIPAPQQCPMPGEDPG